MNWKQRLTKARTDAGMNKTQFAKAVGVSNPTATDWEKPVELGGIENISGKNLIKICEVLKIDERELMATANVGRLRQRVEQLNQQSQKASVHEHLVEPMEVSELFALFAALDKKGRKSILRIMRSAVKTNAADLMGTSSNDA